MKDQIQSLPLNISDFSLNQSQLELRLPNNIASITTISIDIGMINYLLNPNYQILVKQPVQTQKKLLL
ncbi:hypothetical protein [Holzapfeliella floricola]|uniref:hypothetical protein n=1 Tax=Holzapfeliella floricola TaxID=679249 RepID=UPI0007833E3B|nr:hypothetical protein [Holzapfeliella floricola]